MTENEIKGINVIKGLKVGEGIKLNIFAFGEKEFDAKYLGLTREHDYFSPANYPLPKFKIKSYNESIKKYIEKIVILSVDKLTKRDDGVIYDTTSLDCVIFNMEHAN